MADAKQTPTDKVTAADHSTGGDGKSTATNTNTNTNTGEATGGNQPAAALPESVKTGQVPGGSTTQQNLNPSPSAQGTPEPVVQRDFPRAEDNANAAAAAALGSGDEMSNSDISKALSTKPVTDGSLRREMAIAMTAGSKKGDVWPKPMKLVRGKHDGLDYNTGERISGVANDGQIFAISKMSFESFGDKFVPASDKDAGERAEDTDGDGDND